MKNPFKIFKRVRELEDKLSQVLASHVEFGKASVEGGSMLADLQERVMSLGISVSDNKQSLKRAAANNDENLRYSCVELSIKNNGGQISIELASKYFKYIKEGVFTP
jgi:hypothetical protein